MSYFILPNFKHIPSRRDVVRLFGYHLREPIMFQPGQFKREIRFIAHERLVSRIQKKRSIIIPTSSQGPHKNQRKFVLPFHTSKDSIQFLIGG
jgi:hypothetical protein